MKYTKGYKYQLHEDIILYTNLRTPETLITKYITLHPGGMMHIKAGYAWDGPSGPTWDTANSMTPSLFHDAAYQLMRMKLLDRRCRPYVDEEFGRMLEERGMCWVRRKMWIRAVKKLAAGAADPKNQKEVFEVP